MSIKRFILIVFLFRYIFFDTLNSDVTKYLTARFCLLNRIRQFTCMYTILIYSSYHMLRSYNTVAHPIIILKKATSFSTCQIAANICHLRRTKMTHNRQFKQWILKYLCENFVLQVQLTGCNNVANHCINSHL